jgi:hypothetical protein
MTADAVHRQRDSLFPGAPGKTWSPDDFTSPMDDLEERVFGQLTDETWVYPGHGDDTTLGAERPAPIRVARAAGELIPLATHLTDGEVAPGEAGGPDIADETLPSCRRVSSVALHAVPDRAAGARVQTGSEAAGSGACDSVFTDRVDPSLIQVHPIHANGDRQP